MPAPVNSNYSANFQRFVDFANNACATSGENTAARFTGMPKGDYKGSFASLLRTADMKSANDQVRDNFLKTVAGMFGGEKFIPDIVRDNMKLEDFGKGKPLTARRIKLVKIAIDTLGGGKFAIGTPAADRAFQRGYTAAELPKLARAATIYQQATNCTNEEAEAAALDPSSAARRLYDYGGRFTLNAEAFKAGLDLMDKFATWYGNLMDDCAAKNLDTPTKLNLNFSVCTRDAGAAVQKFVFEEIAVNGKIPLNAKNAEDLFGMAKNPAMRFVGRGYTTSFSNSLAQIPPEKRGVIYAVFDALDKLPANAGELAKRDKVGYSLLVAARVMKNFDAVAALQASGKLDRAHLVRILYPDLGVSPGDSNRQISSAYETRVARDPAIMPSLHMLAENSGATLDEADAAISSGTRLENAPGISSFSGKLEEMDGTARGGRKTMIYDLVRPTTPSLTENEKPALADENVKFVFNFPDGETIDTITGSLDEPNVSSRCDAIADKIADLCGNVHPKQLSNVYFALSQSAIGVNVNGGFASAGISSDEHMPVTFTLSRNDETGAVTIKYSEPKGMPVKFNWTTTIDVDGKTTTTQMRIDHGQYEATAMTFAPQIKDFVPGKDKAVAESMIKDMLAHCGDDFDLKDIVSQTISGLCITGASNLRTMDEIKARIDAIRANLAEVRAAADGKVAAERAGVTFLASLSGKSMPPGLIGNITKAATTNPGEYAKLSAASSPKQIFQAVIDMRDAVEKALAKSRADTVLEGGDEMTPVRAYITSLILTRLPADRLQGAVNAFRGETALKLLKLLNAIAAGDYPRGATPTAEQKDAIQTQCMAIGFLFGLYNHAAESVLGRDGGSYDAFDGPIDKNALGHRDIYQALIPIANDYIAAQAEEERRDANVEAASDTAKAHATSAYAKAGEGNAEKVDILVFAALQRCSANADAVQVVANNMDAILVTATSTLRSIAAVRERAEAIAANFAELQALSRNNPAIYEAGKRMMAAMGGRALPPGTIGRLVRAAANAKIDAINKLSPRSSGFDIHRAVNQLRDNLVAAMAASGAEDATEGPNEKQACRNFLAALLMDRCGARTLRTMQGAFNDDKAAKLLTFYLAIGDGHLNGEVDTEIALRFEDQGTSHMTYISLLKDAIDLAATNQLGAGLDPIEGQLNADEIDGPDIVDDLVNIVSR